MCILFLYAIGNPSKDGYKLIVASNRDEFYTRPSASASQWVNHPNVYGGVDLEPGREGGTWLAISGDSQCSNAVNAIKFGALLNIKDKRNSSCLGRGPIVTNYVSSQQNNLSYCRQFLDNGRDYNCFNFVSVELTDKKASIYSCSNSPLGLEEWEEGEIHAFGNSPAKTPFQKVINGKKRFKKNLFNKNGTKEFTDKDELKSELMRLLRSTEKYWPDEELNARAPKGWAEHLSSIFVRVPQRNYGSRTSTVILVDSENRMDFYEETMLTTDPDGEWKSTHIHRQFY